MDSVKNLKNKSWSNMILSINLILISMVALYLFFGKYLLVSEQSIKVWETSLLKSSHHPYLTHVLTTAPLTFQNLLALLSNFLPNISLSTPFFINLILLSIAFWFYTESLLEKLINVSFLKLILFLLVIISPLVSTLIVFSPIDTLNVIILSTVFYGLDEINKGIDSRGVILTSGALVFLFLNGTTGIFLSLSVFICLPLMIKNKIFKTNSFSAYLLVFFPLFTAAISLIFLSFVYKKPLSEFLLSTSVGFSSYQEMLNWGYFLPLLLMNTDFKNFHFKTFIVSNKSILIPALSHFFLISNNLDHTASTLYSVTLFSFAFEILYQPRFSKKLIFGIICLLLSTGFLAFNLIKNKITEPAELSYYHFHHLQSFIKISKEDAEMADFLNNNNSPNSMYFTQNFGKIRLPLKRHHQQIFPNTGEFSFNFEHSGNKIDRYIVENPVNSLTPQFYSKKQAEIFTMGVPGYHLAYQNSSWRVFQNYPPAPNLKKKGDFKSENELIFSKELYTSVLIIVIFILYRLNFLQRLKFLFRK